MSAALTGVAASDPPGQSSVRFDWQPDPAIGVTRYAVEIGTAPGLTDVAIVDVGLAVSYTRVLPHRAYWFRIQSWLGAVAGAVTPDLPILVSNRLGRLGAALSARATGLGLTPGVGDVRVLADQQDGAAVALGVEAGSSVGSLGAGWVRDAAAVGKLGFVTPSVNQPTAITIAVLDWTRTVPVGGRGRVLLQLAASRPLVQVQVKLESQVIGQVQGAELRDLGGLYFSVPRTPGDYALSVRAADGFGISQTTTTARIVTVI